MKQATPIYANWPERLLAYLLDQLIIVVPVAVLAQPFVQVNPAGEILIEPAAYMVIFVVNLAYHSYCVASRWQATLGMRILSMHVARVDGRPLHVRDEQWLAGSGGSLLFVQAQATITKAHLRAAKRHRTRGNQNDLFARSVQGCNIGGHGVEPRAAHACGFGNQTTADFDDDALGLGEAWDAAHASDYSSEW